MVVLRHRASKYLDDDRADIRSILACRHMVTRDRGAILSYLPARRLFCAVAGTSAIADRASGALSGWTHYLLWPRRSAWLLRTDAAASGHPCDRRADRVARVFPLHFRIRTPGFSGRVLVNHLLLPDLRLVCREIRLQHGDVGPYVSGGAFRIDGV